jgi:predicted RND superfamily exporter protein
MRETKTVVIVSTTLLVFGYGVLWLLGAFDGLGFHGTIAAILGIALTTMIGVAVMALIFHSARAGYDKEVHNVWRRKKRKP